MAQRKENAAATEHITNPDEVRKWVQVRRPPGMSDEEFQLWEMEVISMIAVSGALLKGHFLLGPGEEG